MTKKKRSTNDVAQELKRLPLLSVTELSDKHVELFGEPTKSRNKPYLLKKIAWRIQANAGGGLSERAIQRIRELGDALPHRWQERATLARRTEGRDPRLPEPGAVLTRLHAGTEHCVTVLADGFDYAGKKYRSLSEVAGQITGKKWNGFTFFAAALGILTGGAEQ
jgi:hypothetical protein